MGEQIEDGHEADVLEAEGDVLVAAQPGAFQAWPGDMDVQPVLVPEFLHDVVETGVGAVHGGEGGVQGVEIGARDVSFGRGGGGEEGGGEDREQPEGNETVDRLGHGPVLPGVRVRVVDWGLRTRGRGDTLEGIDG